MKESMLGTTNMIHIGILVHDINKSAIKFSEFLAIEPVMKRTGAIEDAKTQYLNKPTNARADLAFFLISPNFSIELIQPDMEPSTWRHDLDSKGEGIHHITFEVKDLKSKKEHLAQAGYPLLQTGEYKNGKYAYIDATEQLKTVIELLENDD